jgi:hypothetical protein
MRNHRPLRNLVLAAALSGPLFGVGCAHAASLFDAIGAAFGAQPEPSRPFRAAPAAAEMGRGGLSLTVRPRRQKPRRERAVARRPQPVQPSVPLNVDPATNPNWFLDDPTLRPGDIVVIKGKVLVFEGSGPAPHAREEFTSLEGSKLSREERERISAMAGLPPVPTGEEARRKTATAGSDLRAEAEIVPSASSADVR